MKSRFAVLVSVFAIAACGGHKKPPDQPKLPSDEDDPDGPHRAAIAAQIQPFLDADLVSGLVVGIYDAGKKEIYGFGHGPGNKAPDGRTLFEIGSITKVYTSLLLADAIQRNEVGLDTTLASMLPPGVTAPTKDGVDITLAHLALHSSGLPRLPPTIANKNDVIDPYAAYSEDALYADLVHTPLTVAPGTMIAYSNFGAGVLGFVLGKKLGGGYTKMLHDRILAPLGLKNTAIGFPESQLGRRAVGTDDDLKSVPEWHFTDTLAGAGGLVSDVRDQLVLIDAELDAAAGSTGTLRRPMKLSQEPQLDLPSNNEGLGWQIDPAGRYWHNGGTGGYHSFIGFDPKTRRGVVILASTSSSLVDRLADAMYAVMDGNAKDPPKLATSAQLGPFAGIYEIDTGQGSPEKVSVIAAGNRLYLEGRGEPRHRLVPVSDHEFWIEALQAVAVFETDKLVFLINGHQFEAKRVPG